MITLRPEQAAQSEEALRLFADSARSVLIQGPTGYGKTPTGSHTALQRAQGRPVVAVAPRREIVQQLRDSLHRAGAPSEQVTVTSIQALLRTPPPPAAVYLLDECRHYVAPEWMRPVEQMRQHGLLLGLDATPCHPHRPLSDLFEHMVQGPQVRQLLEAQRLVPAYHIAPDEPSDTLAIGPVRAYIEHCPGAQGIWFLGSKDEARKTAEHFAIYGVRAEAVLEDSPDRAGSLERFRTGETKVLVNVQILTEGVDLPMCDAVGIFRGCSTPWAWLQMLGRGSRLYPGKERFTVLDPMGHCWRHVGWDADDRSLTLGFFDDDRRWDLSNAPDNGASRPSERMPVQCQAPSPRGGRCMAWTLPPRCSVCGAATGNAKRARRRRVKPKPMSEQRRVAVAKAAMGKGGYLEQWVRDNAARLAPLPNRGKRSKSSKFMQQIYRYRLQGERQKAMALCWRVFKKEMVTMTEPRKPLMRVAGWEVTRYAGKDANSPGGILVGIGAFWARRVGETRWRLCGAWHGSASALGCHIAQLGEPPWPDSEQSNV